MTGKNLYIPVSNISRCQYVSNCYDIGWRIYDVVAIGLIDTGPSEWRWFFIFDRNRPFNEIGSVFSVVELGVRAPEVLNGCNRGRCKASAPFIRPLLGLLYIS
jgi:hypothetical protein